MKQCTRLEDTLHILTPAAPRIEDQHRQVQNTWINGTPSKQELAARRGTSPAQQADRGASAICSEPDEARCVTRSRHRSRANPKGRRKKEDEHVFNLNAD
jgi:hypothetical protein